ncbi:MAG: hypothetical protein BGN89_17500 [Alphaproteobacteria bacterium 64-6]|nr:MAG: hypothetical protein BGN89_17500 [Alphaproteobacteria bacterium 64-6]
MMLERKRFTGAIKRGDDAFALEFDVWSGEDGRLSIEAQPLDKQAIFRLQGAMGEPGSYSESLILEGASADGTTFFSDTVELQGARVGTRKNSVMVEARKAKVTLDCTETAEAPLVRLWFRSFKAFRNPTVTMSLGKVCVGGEQKPSSEDEMSGHVVLQALERVNIDDWLKQAGEFLTFMHLGLAFAHGGRLQTPRKDVIVGNRWEATYYGGRGFRRSLAPIHYLNQGPFIKALAKRFDYPKPFPDMLWTAVGWLHNDNSFDEGRFLMSMTALETVVEHVIPKTLTTVIPRADFKAVRSRLLAALAECRLEKTPEEIFEGKLKSLNRRSLSQKIQTLRDHYGLSKDVFSDHAIIHVIKARNDIVHTGELSTHRDLWTKEVFVRELIALIVFQELGYEGPYESYVNGYRTVHPPSPQDQPASSGVEASGAPVA